MFFEELPRIVKHSLFFKALDPNVLNSHVDVAEDADYLRSRLPALSLIGFVANDSLLPRTSGIDPAPLDNDLALRFQSPPSLQIEIALPNKGAVRGMGIPGGVTLIVGGGYHGKSTLLNALELGIYNHIPGDGRELVVTMPEAFKIRAADGRSIEKTDISPFINNLPFEKNTRTFSTQNASGSTSQAANISEALEAGAKVLLLDEDTSATNFMIRDHRMQRLVIKDQEPITPFIDRVRQLYEQQGVSAVLVMGGSGDYFPEAHQVIQMTAYVPEDVTRKAHQIAQDHPTGRLKEGGGQFGAIRIRKPQADSFKPYRGKRLKIGASRIDEILFGNAIVDIRDVEQIVHISQTRGIALAMHYAARYMDGRRTLKQVIDQVMQDIDTESLDVLSPYITGDIARFRALELAAAMNRMRTLKITQIKP
jgi:predicted ABC-class ATPase